MKQKTAVYICWRCGKKIEKNPDDGFGIFCTCRDCLREIDREGVKKHLGID